MTLESYLRAAPKAELHVHLEGAIQPATVLALAARNGITLPVSDEAGLRQLFTYRDFPHFAEIFVMVTRCLQTVADYELIVYEFGAEMVRQNCRYAEVTFSPATQQVLGMPQEVYFTGLTRGRARVKAELGVEINWIFDIVRNWDDASRNVPLADYTTAVAIEGMADGVVALGLAGKELGGPPEPYVSWFDRARAAGLHSAPHAGETVGPESIWGALRMLGAERIAHGVRAVEDAALVEYLAMHQMPLDMTPTSNICLGVFPHMAAHAFPRLYAAGIPLTIGSDDPPLFNTTLNDEVALLADPFGLDVAAIDEILLNSVRHSFLPTARKQTLEAAFRAELGALKTEHLAG